MEEIEKKTEEKPEELLIKSFKLIGKFYTKLFLLLFIIFAVIFLILRNNNSVNLAAVVIIIFIGNLIIAVLTQTLQYILLKQNVLGDGNKDKKIFLYPNVVDCSFRCSAGIIEMVFYTIAFAISMPELIVGYLVLKTVSVWKSNENQRTEGLFTSVLRVAVVLSLFFSLIASYFLFRYLRLFSIFELGNHFLFK